MQPKAWWELLKRTWNCLLPVLPFSCPTLPPQLCGAVSLGFLFLLPPVLPWLGFLAGIVRALPADHARAALVLLLGHITEGHRACAGGLSSSGAGFDLFLLLRLGFF